jgi:hypothetical protein
MGLPYVWDYDLTESQFQSLLDGKETIGRLDSDWAAIRLLDYAPYPEIVRLLGFKRLVAGWPRWRKHVRSYSRRRGFDFLVTWLPIHYPDLVR